MATTGGGRRTGRPTNEEARQLDRAIRDAALRLFLANGYGATSMDAIASAAGTTKVTLYARFPSKEAMFRATLERAATRRDWPDEEPAPGDPDDLEGALLAVARAAVARATHPAMVGLARIAVTEVARFPELVREAGTAPVWPRWQVVAELLKRHAASGAIVLPADARQLAETFIGLVAAEPGHLAAFGIVRDAAAQDERTALTVRLFVRGLRPV